MDKGFLDDREVPEMTDEKDWFKNIKEKRRKMDAFDRSYEVNRIDSVELDQLIQEIETLRAEAHGYIGACRSKDIKIDSLTKERDNLQLQMKGENNEKK